MAGLRDDNVYDPNYVPPSANEPNTLPVDRSRSREFSKGLERGVNQLQAGAYGAAAVVGDVVGSETLEDFGAEGYARNMEEASAVPRGNVESVFDIDSVETFLDWAAYGLGQLAPSALTMAGTGGVGALVGGATRFGAMAGAGFGAFAGSATPETGHAYEEIKEGGGGKNAGAAILQGSIIGLLDVAPQTHLLKLFGKTPGKAGMLRRIGSGAVQQAGLEGATEAAQEGVGHLVQSEVNPGYKGEGIGKRLVEAGALGALGGGVMGGVGGAASGVTSKFTDTERAALPAAVPVAPSESMQDEMFRSVSEEEAGSDRTGYKDENLQESITPDDFMRWTYPTEQSEGLYYSPAADEALGWLRAPTWVDKMLAEADAPFLERAQKDFEGEQTKFQEYLDNEELYNELAIAQDEFRRLDAAQPGGMLSFGPDGKLNYVDELISDSIYDILKGTPGDTISFRDLAARLDFAVDRAPEFGDMALLEPPEFKAPASPFGRRTLYDDAQAEAQRVFPAGTEVDADIARAVDKAGMQKLRAELFLPQKEELKKLKDTSEAGRSPEAKERIAKLEKLLNSPKTKKQIERTRELLKKAKGSGAEFLKFFEYPTVPPASQLQSYLDEAADPDSSFNMSPALANEFRRLVQSARPENAEFSFKGLNLGQDGTDAKKVMYLAEQNYKPTVKNQFISNVPSGGSNIIINLSNAVNEVRRQRQTSDLTVPESVTKKGRTPRGSITEMQRLANDVFMALDLLREEKLIELPSGIKNVNTIVTANKKEGGIRDIRDEVAKSEKQQRAQNALSELLEIIPEDTVVEYGKTNKETGEKIRQSTFGDILLTMQSELEAYDTGSSLTKTGDEKDVNSQELNILSEEDFVRIHGEQKRKDRHYEEFYGLNDVGVSLEDQKALLQTKVEQLSKNVARYEASVKRMRDDPEAIRKNRMKQIEDHEKAKERLEAIEESHPKLFTEQTKKDIELLDKQIYLLKLRDSIAASPEESLQKEESRLAAAQQRLAEVENELTEVSKKAAVPDIRVDIDLDLDFRPDAVLMKPGRLFYLQKNAVEQRGFQEEVNVYFGANENAELSNLADRPFEDSKGKKYFSVEHAYQSWKSGVFDQQTYAKYKKAGVKIPGNKGTKKENNWNVKLMKRLMLQSFEQNPEAQKALLATGEATITHKQDKGIWREEFPRLLMEVRQELVGGEYKNTSTVTKVISGGQQGADNAGLFVAARLGIETGGTAPLGYMIDKDAVDAKTGKPLDKEGVKAYQQQLKDFGVAEHPEKGYPPRTEQNVIDSDGTVIIGENSPGSGATKRFAQDHNKPYIWIRRNNPHAAKEIRAWLDVYKIKTLNVAGNRESTQPGISKEVFVVLRDALSNELPEVTLKVNLKGRDTSRATAEMDLAGAEILTTADTKKTTAQIAAEKKVRVLKAIEGMDFNYGKNKRRAVRATNTFDAILSGQRTQTTRKAPALRYKKDVLYTYTEYDKVAPADFSAMTADQVQEWKENGFDEQGNGPPIDKTGFLNGKLIEKEELDSEYSEYDASGHKNPAMKGITREAIKTKREFEKISKPWAWDSVRAGDKVKFTTDKGDFVIVKVTSNKLLDLEGRDKYDWEGWSKREGWKPAFGRNYVKDRETGEEARTRIVQFELLAGVPKTKTDSQGRRIDAVAQKVRTIPEPFIEATGYTEKQVQALLNRDGAVAMVPVKVTSPGVNLKRTSEVPAGTEKPTGVGRTYKKVGKRTYRGPSVKLDPPKAKAKPKKPTKAKLAEAQARKEAFDAKRASDVPTPNFDTQGFKESAKRKAELEAGIERDSLVTKLITVTEQWQAATGAKKAKLYEQMIELNTQHIEADRKARIEWDRQTNNLKLSEAIDDGKPKLKLVVSNKKIKSKQADLEAMVANVNDMVIPDNVAVDNPKVIEIAELLGLYHEFIRPISSFPWRTRSRDAVNKYIWNKYLTTEDILKAGWIERRAQKVYKQGRSDNYAGLRYLRKLVEERVPEADEKYKTDTFNDGRVRELSREMAYAAQLQDGLPGEMDFAKVEYGWEEPKANLKEADSKVKEKSVYEKAWEKLAETKENEIDYGDVVEVAQSLEELETSIKKDEALLRKDNYNSAELKKDAKYWGHTIGAHRRWLHEHIKDSKENLANSKRFLKQFDLQEAISATQFAILDSESVLEGFAADTDLKAEAKKAGVTVAQHKKTLTEKLKQDKAKLEKQTREMEQLKKDGPKFSRAIEEVNFDVATGKLPDNQYAKKAFDQYVSRVNIPGKIVLLDSKGAIAALAGHKQRKSSLFAGTLHGFSTVLTDGSIAVYVHPGLNKTLTQEVLAHEVGHAVYRAYANTLDAKTASKIMREYMAWRTKHKKSNATLQEILHSKKQAKSAILAMMQFSQNPNVRLDQLSEKAQEYTLDFEEWFADNVSRWFTENKAPATGMERFFRAIADTLRKLVGLAPKGSINSLMESIAGGSRTSNLPFSLPGVVAASEALPFLEKDLVKVKALYPEQFLDSRGHNKNDGDYIAYLSVLDNQDPYSDSFHKAFRTFLWSDNLAPNVKSIILRAAQSKRVQGQIRTLFEHDRDLIQSLADPYVAATYMYQLNKAGLISLGQRTETVLQKIAKFLRDMLGIIADSENAAAIFRVIEEGLLPLNQQTQRSHIQRILPGSVAEKVIKALGPAYETAMKPMRAIFIPIDQRVRSFDNPALTKIAEAFHNPPGEFRTDPTMQSAKQEFMSRFENIVRITFEGQTAKFGEEALEFLYGVRPLREAKPQTAKVVTKMRKLFVQMLKYQQEAGVDISQLRAKSGKPIHYFPWVANTEYVMENVDAFRDMLAQDKYKQGRTDLAEYVNVRNNIARLIKEFDLDVEGVTAAKQSLVNYATTGKWKNADIDYMPAGVKIYTQAEIVDYMVENAVAEGAGLADVDVSDIPVLRFNNARIFKFVEPAEMRPYLSNDIGVATGTYISQAVKHAEYTRRFGVNSEKLNSLREEAKRLGATKKQLEVTDNYVKASLGTYGRETAEWLHKYLKVPMPKYSYSPIHEGVNKAMGIAIVYQNLRYLSLATLTSLADVMGIAVRSSEFTAIIKSTKAFTKRNQTHLKDLGEMLGVTEHSQVADALGWRYDGMYLTGKLRRFNEGFFRIIGLQAWTRTTRLMALAAAESFIVKHSQRPTKHSKRWMQELNLTPNDILLHTNGTLRVLTHGERNNASKAEVARDDLVRNALIQWVDEAILRPNPSMRTLWGSDPHFQLFQYLKSFMYSFHERILKRVGHEAMEGNWAAFIWLLAYIPVMIVSDLIREGIQFGTAGDPRKANWGMMDYVQSGAVRGGLLGYTQQGLDIHTDLKYGGFGISGMAATFDTVASIPDLIMMKEGAVMKQLPGQTFYKEWFQ